MRAEPDGVDDRVGAALDRDGVAISRGVVPDTLVDRLVDAIDSALAIESPDFPPGDDQHGRLLFAPSHGGVFVDLCGFDPLFEPIERLLGDDSIIYTMTTSVLAPGSAGPVHEHHVDLPPERPGRLALSAIVLVDPFTPENGATEFLAGSHRGGVAGIGEPLSVLGEPGDVCYFDPRALHRSTLNRTGAPRRAVLVQMVRPWMKQRVDVPAFLGDEVTARVEGSAARRLGLTSLPPRSRAEFLERRGRRPW